MGRLAPCAVRGAEKFASVPRMTWQWPTLRARAALLLLLPFAGVGLAQGLMVSWVHALRGGALTYPEVLLQLTGAITAWAALPVVQTVVLNAAPLARPKAGGFRWAALLAVHLAGYCVFTGLHVLLMRGLRTVLFSLSLLHGSDGTLAARILWEAQNDLIVYASVAGVLTMLQAWGERDLNATRAVALEARLAEAKLAALSAQVDPHFFYNALNTLSAVMYEDLPKTERLLAHLGEIMRATLREGAATWTMTEERVHTERYVELLQARFGDRLQVEWHDAPGVGTAQVPRFAIQTLLENAVKHNAARVEPLRIRVDSSLDDGKLAVTVEDDGAGFDAGAGTNGNGLARLRQTLDLLHTGRASLECGAAARGGARVRFELPFTS